MFVDFDGTITRGDTTDVILERFADAQWRKVEADWVAGRIGSRDCLARQIDLVRASPEALDDLVGAVEFDPGFPIFVNLCRQHGVPVTVVSDGLDRVANAILARAGVDVPLIANRLEWLGRDRWRLAFPHARSDCRSAAGNCKCTTLGAAPETTAVLIGDGRSDICAAESADLVLAKGTLAEHCRGVGLAFIPFTDFAGATSLLADWIGAQKRREHLPRSTKVPIHAPPTA
jgi:2-hydroxy-3-keto-5-methylthiopentenyl-1-phosphate phosphatase